MAMKLLNQLRRSVYRTTNTCFLNTNFALLHVRPLADAAKPSNVNVAAPPASTSSLNEVELAKFSAIADTWWDAEGPFKPLHIMNPTRLAFIRSTLYRHFGKDPFSPRPFEGLKFVDVGCGRGILSSESTEKMVQERREFDAVIALEVIEHVADPAEFCKSLAAITAPHGATVISTINRSVRSYATTIVVAEYILHWIAESESSCEDEIWEDTLWLPISMVLQRKLLLPKGTHEWSSFLTTEELALILHRASISVQEMAGFAYNPLTGR